MFAVQAMALCNLLAIGSLSFLNGPPKNQTEKGDRYYTDRLVGLTGSNMDS